MQQQVLVLQTRTQRFKISEALLEIGVNVSLVRQVVRNGAVDLLEREGWKAINHTLWGRAMQESIDHGIQGHAGARDAIGTLNLCDVGCGHRCASGALGRAQWLFSSLLKVFYGDSSTCVERFSHQALRGLPFTCMAGILTPYYVA